MDILKPKKILEIGTAVGYSAIFMQKMSGARIFTIEKDDEMVKTALKNIETQGCQNYIIVNQGDGAEVCRRLKDEGEKDFDLVFIDAAKSHNLEFFLAAKELCKPGAVIVTDNVLFKGWVIYKPEEFYRKHRTNVRNLREYNEYICKEYSSVILPVGDGLAITKL